LEAWAGALPHGQSLILAGQASARVTCGTHYVP